MKKSLLLPSLFVSAIGLSQPVITDASNLAGIGYTYPFSVAPSVTNVGPSGAGQNWDFSAEPFNTVTDLSVVDPSGTAMGASFPNANWCYVVGNMYSYFEITASEMINWAAIITATGGNNDYSANPKTLMEFPFSYGSSFTDDYTELGSTSTVLVTYDGYGTLTMPGGVVYDNVIRVSEDYGGTVDYRWYTLNPLMSVVVYDADAQTMYWVDGPELGTAELTQDGTVELKVFPNPATQEISVRFTTQNQEETYHIYRLDGQRIGSYSIACVPGEQNLKIPVNQLSTGSYYIVIGDLRQNFVVK